MNEEAPKARPSTSGEDLSSPSTTGEVLDPTLRQVIEAGHRGELAVVEAGLSSPSWRIRSAALSGFSRLGMLDQSRLTAGVADPDPGVRRRAAELSPTATSDDSSWPGQATDLLVRMLDDPDDRVLEAAAFTLGEIGESAAPACARLARLVADHPDPLIRETAVAALGAIGHSSALAAILQATSDKPAVRRRAVLALAAFEGPEVDQALDRALEDRDWQVRQAAEDLTGEPERPPGRGV